MLLKGPFLGRLAIRISFSLSLGLRGDFLFDGSFELVILERTAGTADLWARIFVDVS